MAKNLVSGAILPKFGPPIFKKNLPSSLTRYHGQLSSCTVSEKVNDSFLRKLSDGRANRQTGGRTKNTAVFERRCLTNQVFLISLLTKCVLEDGFKNICVLKSL